MLRSCMLVLGFALAVTASVAAQDKKAAKFDPAKLPGTYSFEEGVKNGEKVPADHLKGMSLIVTKDMMTMKTTDGDFVFKYTVDATKSPVALDLEITEGPVGKGSKSKGIIALEGSTLKIAYNPMEGAAPKDFDANKGTDAHSFTLKKMEPKKK